MKRHLFIVLLSISSQVFSMYSNNWWDPIDNEVHSSSGRAHANKPENRALWDEILKILNNPTVTDFSKLEKILDESGADINARDWLGHFTPILFAVGENNEPLTKFLLKRKPQLNTVDFKFTYTPLHWAIIKDNKNIVKMLLKAGADVNLPSSAGKTALEVAQKENNPEIINMIQEYMEYAQNKPQIKQDTEKYVMDVLGYAGSGEGQAMPELPLDVKNIILGYTITG